MHQRLSIFLFLIFFVLAFFSFSIAGQLVYSTFLGGNDNDSGYAIAVDKTGNAYITGGTESANFPTTTGAYDTTFNGGHEDVFVCKLNASGSVLLYSTLLGGSQDQVGNYEHGEGIAVDNAGNAYITGETQSQDFPVTPGAFSTSLNSYGYPDAFVCKLNPSGSALIYSTFLGGNDWDAAHAIVIDSIRNAYITGSSASANFPTTTGAFDRTLNGSWDAFITKLNATGSALIYSTFLGGSDGSEGDGIALDNTGNVYIAGMTYSTDFPTTAGAFDRTYNNVGNNDYGDMFITKLNVTGSALIYSTYLGGSGNESLWGNGIAVDGSGNAYITGWTTSSDFPTTPGAYDRTYNGMINTTYNFYDGDVFVTKLNSNGSALLYSTYLGGSGADVGNSIAVDSNGNASITGWTNSSTDFPITSGAFDTFYNGFGDVFVSKLNASGTALVYSTYLGGGSEDKGLGIALDSSGNAYITGFACSSNFPTTSGAFDTTYNGGYEDAFVTKLSLVVTPTPPVANFYGTPTSGAVPLTVQFHDTSSGNPTSWLWTFGDGNTSTVENPFNIYNTPGTYTVTLIASNAYGTSTISKSNYIVSQVPKQLFFSTFLGGEDLDYGSGIAIDGSGNAYITGVTWSSDFPTTPSAYDTSFNGSTSYSDVFVTKLNASGTALVYSTYLGGGGDDYGSGIAIDGSGNAYITGQTYSTNFPTTPGAFDTSFNGSGCVFVSKLNSSGTALVYSTYLGGDGGYRIAIDGLGNAYITGYTYSSNFPTTPSAFDTSFNGDDDAFVTKLNASGSALIYSTFLGGSGTEVGDGIAVDSAGNAYITGQTNSSDFPTTPGVFDRTFNGDADMFVTKLNATGSTLIYSTYLGGSGHEDVWGNGIAVDGAGNAYITGWTTSSTDFPTTPGAFDTACNGNYDAFVTKLNASGTALIYSTYLGGGNDDASSAVAIDGSGNAYLTGEVYSSNFPTTPGALDTTFNGYSNNTSDVFVTKLNASGTALVYSTYLGGVFIDGGSGIAVDGSGNAYITGYTQSTDFPTTPGAYNTLYNGGYSDVFVSKLSLIPYFPPAVANIPDIKLLKGQSQADVFKLNNYLINLTTANWTWSSKSTYANLSIDGNSWVDYLTPWSSIPGQDTVVFVADGLTRDTSILKYSTYLLKRLPDAIVDNGRKLLNCDINLANYISKDTSIGYPSSYPYELRYSNSSDSGKLNITFSGNTIRINPTGALLGSAKVVVTATPGVAYDWDKEIINVSEVLNGYGEFSSASDTTQYWYVLPVMGASSLPGISWVSNAGGRSGVLALNFSTASQGVKVVSNQEIDIQPFTWYTMRCAFASSAGAGNKHQVSGQLFGVDTLTGTSETGEFLRQPGLMRDTTWWTQYAYIYSLSSTMVKLRPMLVVKNNGSSGTVYVDSMLVYASKPMTESALGGLAKSPLSNESFDNGLSGWFYGLPAQGVDPSTPLPFYAVVTSVFGQENALAVGFTQVSQGLKITSDPVVSITPIKNLKLSWKVYSYENNPHRSITGRIYCVDTTSIGSLSDAIGPSGLSSGSMSVGEWLTYTAVGTPLLNTETQARVQLVVKNGTMATDSLYLDDITLEQENDSPYYWDHTLF